MGERLNPRFAAYTRVKGYTHPDEVMEREGHCGGFLAWNNERWREWRTLNGRKENDFKSRADHDAYDAWLLERFPA